MGWSAEVVAVYPEYTDAYSTDDLLLKTIPADIPVHHVKAWKVDTTKKFGLGSLSMRSFFFIKKKGNLLLSKNKFDLVYFSTTAFHVLALGPYWKKKFNVPFIIDMQDPWRNDFYLDKPVAERPPKFRIAYTIDKYLEKYTMPAVSGIICVSRGYCDMLKQRYPYLKEKQFRVITFGTSTTDFECMERYISSVPGFHLDKNKLNVLYIGRGGHDLSYALEIIFKAFSKGIKEQPHLFKKLHLTFAGTSYAAKGSGKKTVLPVAEKFGIQQYVTESTDRVAYFDSLYLLKHADMLLVPGSTDKNYTASKIFPYVLARKPLLAVFYKGSSVVQILSSVNYGSVTAFDDNINSDNYVNECYSAFVTELAKVGTSVEYNRDAFDPYLAKQKTKEQVDFFNEVLVNFKNISRA